jgi:murein DD-endopeptidase MepM/ murein hydrolase activator NlpD
MKFAYLFLFFISNIYAQNQYPKTDFRSPLDIPMQLSGNFGELRANHFHAGLDYKTKKVEGLPVYAVADGYVSRIKISLFGYGKAIYITHKNGYTTVYGHLQKASPIIEKYIKENQYKNKTFEIELFLKPDELPVNQSDVIAFSGNTGGSEGPHLHFEIRDSKTEKIINPMLFGFDSNLNDTKTPSIVSLLAYPIGDNSVVNESLNPSILNVSLQKDGSYVSDKVIANGKLGFGVNTYDLSNYSWDKNGIYKSSVFLNGKQIYGYQFDTFAFDESRYVNALIDYSRYKKLSQRVQKLFSTQPFPLSILQPFQENGIVSVNSNRNQVCRIEISDFHNNKSIISIPILFSDASATDVSAQKKTPFFIKYNQEYNYEKENWSVYFPANTFYEDFYFGFNVTDKTLILPNETIPVHTNFLVSVQDSISSEMDKQKMFIANFDNKKWKYCPTKLKNNVFSTYTKNWGQYQLMKDTTAPKIIISKAIEGKWITNQKTLQFIISDDLSGIKEYNGYLNGKWILFEYDLISKKITHNFDDAVFDDGKNDLKLIVIDNLGNSTIFETQFFRKK